MKSIIYKSYNKHVINILADGEINVNPLSLSPPPRIKRKRTSPPEVQAALKEIKKLIRRDGNADNDDDGNTQLMENCNLRKPKLQFVGDISSNNENQQRRSCSKCEYFNWFSLIYILV